MTDRGWNEALYLPDLHEMLDWAKSERSAGKLILPDENSILKAFELTPYGMVTTVILGQDPYPGADKDGTYHAMGLSFSSNSKTEIPASLKNIHKELHADLGILNNTADLTKWAKQGVLLLNSVLTVEAGKANSHRGKGWEKITSMAIRLLGKSDVPIVFMLWGKQAQESMFLITGKNKLILTAAHPSPLSANTGFFGCGHFSKANKFLAENNMHEIDWQL